MVDMLLVATYAIGLPLLGTTAAGSAAALSWKSATEGMDAAARRPFRGRLLVFLELPATVVLFGAVLTFLIASRSDDVPAAQLEWAALTMGVPGMLTGVAYAIIYHPGVAHSIRAPTDFGRVVVLATLPQTAALFGFAMGLLILGQASDPASLAAVVEASRVAALYLIAGSFVVPFEAYAMVAYWRFESQKRWSRTIVVGSGLEVILLVAFALAFLSLRTA